MLRRQATSKIFWEGETVKMRWAGYFEQVLHVEDVREASINVIGGFRMPVIEN